MSCEASQKDQLTSLFMLQKVTVEYDGKTILSNITVNIKPNGVLGIIGPSGSGKSTFLRLLNKLIPPSAGKIYYRGKNLTELPARELRKEVGMLQQKPYLFEGTVRENIEYGPNLWGISYKDEELQMLLEKVALDPELLNRKVSSLSVGEQQRVDLARTLANKPSTLLLDEPTSSLDVASKDLVEQTIRRLATEGIKIIIVTHSLKQTKTLTNRLLLLKAGQLKGKTKTEVFFKENDEQKIRKFFQAEDEKNAGPHI